MYTKGNCSLTDSSVPSVDPSITKKTEYFVNKKNLGMRFYGNIAETVEIKNIGTQLILSCKGDFCSQETILADNENGSVISSKKNEIVQGIFSLKYLVLFTKCTNLCTAVELYLKNDYPIIVQYPVSSLGFVKMCLAPLNNTQ